MSDDKKPPKPIDDLKEGLGLLFRAAKGAVEKLPTDKVETVAKDAAKQVGKTLENIGSEMDKAWNRATGSEPPKAGETAEAKAADASDEKKDDEEKKDEAKPEAKFDDAYAPEPPKGPRIG